MYISKLMIRLTLKIQKMRRSSCKIHRCHDQKILLKIIFAKYKLLYSNNDDPFFYVSLAPFFHTLQSQTKLKQT